VLLLRRGPGAWAMNEGITGRDKAYHALYLSIPENVAAERKLPAPPWKDHRLVIPSEAHMHLGLELLVKTGNEQSYC